MERFFEQSEPLRMTGTEGGRDTLRATKCTDTHEPRTTHANAHLENSNKLSPAGLEPTTYGLKGAAGEIPKLLALNRMRACQLAHDSAQITGISIDCKGFCTGYTYVL